MTSILAVFIRTRWDRVNHRHRGSTTARVRARRHSMVNITARAPTMVRVQMRMFSGP